MFKKFMNAASKASENIVASVNKASEGLSATGTGASSAGASSSSKPSNGDEPDENIEEAIDVEETEGGEDSSSNKATAQHTAAWTAYLNKYIPLERATTFSSEELLVEKSVVATIGRDTWESLSHENRLDIIRAYATETDRLNVTSRNARDIADWRAKHSCDTIVKSGPLPGSELYHDHWPSRLAGQDEYGHPILYDRISTMEVSRMLSIPDGDFFSFRTQALETLSFVKEEISRARGHRVSKHVYILDLKGSSVSKHFSSQIKAKMKPVLQMSSKIFPETLWSLWLINAPAAFRMAWSVVRQWLDPITRAKIRMFGHVPAKYHAAMAATGIPLSALPHEFGGTHRSESLFDVLQRAKLASMPDAELEAKVTAYYKQHNPSKLEEVPGLVAGYAAGSDKSRAALAAVLERKYGMPLDPHDVQVTFQAGSLGLRIDDRAIPGSLSVSQHTVVVVLGFTERDAATNQLGQAERSGLVRVGDIIARVEDRVVVGMRESEVKKILVEAPRPVRVTFWRAPAALLASMMKTKQEHVSHEHAADSPLLETRKRGVSAAAAGSPRMAATAAAAPPAALSEPATPASAVASAPAKPAAQGAPPSLVARASLMAAATEATIRGAHHNIDPLWRRLVAAEEKA